MTHITPFTGLARGEARDMWALSDGLYFLLSLLCFTCVVGAITRYACTRPTTSFRLMPRAIAAFVSIIVAVLAFIVAATLFFGVTLQEIRAVEDWPRAEYVTVDTKTVEYTCFGGSSHASGTCYELSATLQYTPTNKPANASTVTMRARCANVGCNAAFFAQFPPVGGTHAGAYDPADPTQFVFDPCINWAMAGAEIVLAVLVAGCLITGCALSIRERKNDDVSRTGLFQNDAVGEDEAFLKSSRARADSKEV